MKHRRKILYRISPVLVWQKILVLNVECFNQGCGSRSGSFSVEAEAQKFYRFCFHIGGKNGGRKKLVLLSFREEQIGGGINIKK